MPEPATSPTCECGYDLSGHAGPPWRCPECGATTREWPPPGDRHELPPAETRVLAWSIGIGVVASGLVPWVHSTGSPMMRTISASIMLTANIAALFFAGTLAVWIGRNVPGWQKILAIVPFLMYSVAALIVVWSAFYISLTIHQWISPTP